METTNTNTSKRTKKEIGAELLTVAQAERRTFQRMQRLSVKGGAKYDEARATWEAFNKKLSALEGEYVAA